MPTTPSPIVITPDRCGVWITTDGLVLTAGPDDTDPLVTIRRPARGDLAGARTFSVLAEAALRVRSSGAAA